MLQLQALGRLTTSLEAIVYDLYAMPEQINPSVVRTVSQAIDFLAVLFEEKTLKRSRIRPRPMYSWWMTSRRRGR